MREIESHSAVRGRPFVGALLCAGLVLAAVILEVLGGQNANSPHAAWAELVVPLAWPQPLRVLWWLVIGVAAGAYRILLGRAGFPQRRVVTVITVVPFVVFAAGIAAGAGWATWH